MADKEGRVRKPSEKGREYQLEMKGKEVKRLRSKLTGQISLFETLLRSNDVSLVKAELETVVEYLTELQVAVREYTNVANEGDSAQMIRMLDAEEKSVARVKKAVYDWIEAHNTSVADIGLTNQPMPGNERSLIPAIVGELANVEHKSGADVDEKERDKSNIRKTVEVMRVQVKLENQVALFNDLARSKNVDLVKRELKNLEMIHTELKSIVDPLMGILGEEEKEKMNIIVDKAGLQVQATRQMVATVIADIREEDNTSQASGLSGSSNKTKGLSDSRRNLLAEEDRSKKRPISSKSSICKETEIAETIEETFYGTLHRIENQEGLVRDLLKTDNTKMMNKELETLDSMYESMAGIVNNLMVSSTIEVQNDISDKWNIMESRLFETKRLSVRWMGEQAEAERNSQLSIGSYRSRESNKTTKTQDSREKGGEQRHIEILRKQLKKNQERLKEQEEFFVELSKGKDLPMLTREMQVMERFFENTEAVVNQLKKKVSTEERKCLTNCIMEEEDEVMNLKKRFIKWMARQQDEAEKSSETSCASRKSRSSRLYNLGDHDISETGRKDQLEHKVNRLWLKFEKQKVICKNVIKVKNVDMLYREIQKLEDVHGEIKDTTATLHELLNRQEAEDIMEKVENEETHIFHLKTTMLKLMGGDIDDNKEEEVKVKVNHLEPVKDKGKEAEDMVLRKEVVSAKSRLDSQKNLVEDLLEADGSVSICRELEALDRVYDKFVSVASDLRNKAAPEEKKEVSELIDAEDANVFSIKKKASRLSEMNKVKADEEDKRKIEEEVCKAGGTDKSSNSLVKLNELIIKTMRQQAAPKPEIETFNGDPLEFDFFMENFKDGVESFVDDPRQCFMRLLKFTSGEAKDLIKHCVHEPADTCYKIAKDLLENEYGSKFKVACAYLEKLNKWQQIKSNDAAGLRELYRFLLQGTAYNKKGMIDLDSPLTIRTIQLSLPNHLQDKWAGRVGKIRKNKNREANFTDFVALVEEESRNLNDPLYSRHSLKDKGDGKIKAFLTEVKEGGKITCPLCKNNHDLDDCEQFKGKVIREKKDFLFKLRLCFLCLGKGHGAKDCSKKRICATCGKEHPTCLHDVTFKVSSIKQSSGMGGLCIVLVQMYHKSQPEKVIQVYAMLDECSQGTFVQESLIEYLSDEQKRLTTVTVSTVNTETESIAYAIVGLVVKGTEKFGKMYQAAEIALPVTYTKPKLPMGEEDVPKISEISKWGYLQEVVDSLTEGSKWPLGLLIGRNCKRALEPMQVIPSKREGPYATRTRLGWYVVGENDNCSSHMQCNGIKLCTPLTDVTGKDAIRHIVLPTRLSDNSIKDALQDIWRADFIENEGEQKGLSKDDKKFIELMKKGIKFKDGHYELPLPLRTESNMNENEEEKEIDKDKVSILLPEEVGADINLKIEDRKESMKRSRSEYVVMPDSRGMALQRLKYIKRKMQKDTNFKTDYTAFMNKLIVAGYARKVPEEQRNKRGWMLPHHDVRHPTKKKIRVVFDCSAEREGVSLNSRLIQGPDPANSLVGLLLRFRKGKIAFMADIETMYYQVGVPEEHYKFLRFFWWEKGDIESDPVEYEMCVHPFGAISSKSCVIFALHQTAIDNEDKYAPDVIEMLLYHFYVDDLLTSVDSEQEAIKMIAGVDGLCRSGGFNLTKFVCANAKVLNSIPPEKRAEIKEIHNFEDIVHSESALGAQWLIRDDMLGFQVDFSKDDGTRRGCLSTIHRIKDPLGLGAPFLLKGRKILQKLAVESVSWDKKLTPEVAKQWSDWRSDLTLLNNLKIRRCYRPSNFGEVTEVTLHCFSDASFVGYGAAYYLRFVDHKGDIEVSLVMGKSRVSPTKATTVPRLELTAATVCAKIAAVIMKELKLDDVETFYWVDNKIVLGYIFNQTRRYRVFVANRVQAIEDLTGNKNWNYVPTKENPADYSSRGISLKESEKVFIWLHGPKFLRRQEDTWRTKCPEVEEIEDDIEVKVTTTVNAVKMGGNMKSILDIMEKRISSWHRMKRVVAWVRRFVALCRKEDVEAGDDLVIAEIQGAEQTIIKWVQERSFRDDIEIVRRDRKEKIKKKVGNLWRICPFIDKDGVLRVGGRLSQAEETENFRFPVILPKRAMITKRLVEWHHKKIEHRGKHSTISELREAGYWVVSASKEVGAVVRNCVRCKWLRGKFAEQKMADLPSSRTTIEPPFTFCGVDFFGHILVKEGRKSIKRYGVLFTCFSLRAVHIEVASSLETDAFIQALTRFIARRGEVREIRCDNGSNLRGAENELKAALNEMDHQKIKAYLTEQGADWIVWESNTPAASHMGGVWERQIRTVKNVLTSLIKSCPRTLDEETLRTFLTEAEGIVNSRPLTIENLLDPDSAPLTPNQILTMKSRWVAPPPGVFQEADVYCRKRWRIAQHLANAFWSRWRQQYLQLQQARQKWGEVRRNSQIGDVVMLKEEGVARGHWPIARVTEVHPSADGLVRSVTLQKGKSILKRPIHKTVLLVAAEPKAI